MKNNDIFSFSRFRKYFGSDLRSCSANYGLSLLTISLLTPLATYAIFLIFSIILGDGWGGLSMGTRASFFSIAMACLIVTMPVRCYGKITEKQYGSFWLTLPASRLEKVVSMIIITCIVAPALGVVMYLGMDALICAIDHTCGDSLISAIYGFINEVSLSRDLADIQINLADGGITLEDSTINVIQQMTSPWLYIDDIFGITLPFLLGAIFFKSGKTVKTILSMAAITTVLSIIIVPLAMSYIESYFDKFHDVMISSQAILNSGIFKHMALIDTISDTIVNLSLLTGIWLRVKTLKH